MRGDQGMKCLKEDCEIIAICRCKRCEQESDDNEKFFSCLKHNKQQNEYHRKIRDRDSYWWPSKPGTFLEITDYGEII